MVFKIRICLNPINVLAIARRLSFVWTEYAQSVHISNQGGRGRQMEINSIKINIVC